MKKIVVCYKWLLDDADIRVNDATRQLDYEKAKYKLNEYDRNGIETGAQLKAATGAELIGVTCGTATAASAKDALSRGLDAVTCLNTPAMADADNRATAKVLASMIGKIGDVDLVICSEASSDELAQQTSTRVAVLLGYASVSFVTGVEATGDGVTLTRKLEDGLEHVSVTGPVVISVSPDFTPPIPGVKQILGAKKKPANSVDLGDVGLSEADLAPQFTTESVLAPVVSRKALRMNPEGVTLENAAATLVKHLAADGVL